MQVNSISNFNQISYGKSSRLKKTQTAENRSYADSFRNMTKSPTFDVDIADIDEFTYRTGVEDYHTETMLKSQMTPEEKYQDQIGRLLRKKAEKPASISSKEQADAVKKLITQLQNERECNPSEARHINAQIGRLRGILSRYYKAFAKTIK